MKNSLKSFVLLLVISAFPAIGHSTACDEWIADGYSAGALNNKYKITNCSATLNIVNIQSKSDQAAIYITFPSDVGLTVSGATYEIQGAGVFLFLSSFTQKYTEITVTSNGTTYTFDVYYEDGIAATSKLYWVKPQGWSWTTPLYAYMWDGGNNNGWPGVEMSTNTSVTLEKCTADIYYWDYSASYNTLQLHETDANDATREKLDGLSILGENMYYVPTIMSNTTDVTTWKWCASQDMDLLVKLGATENTYSFSQGAASTLTVSVSLEAETTYEFKLHQTQEGTSNGWWGNSGTMTSSNCTEWNMADASNNCHITTTIAGAYVFTYNYTTDRLSVEYPRPSQCSGDLGHFGTPDTKRISYTIEYLPISDKIKYTVQGYGVEVLDFLQVQTTQGNSGDVAIVNGVATWLQTAPAAGTEMGINFLYSTDAIGGNEMNSESTAMTFTGNNANLVYYRSHDCEVVEVVAPTPTTAPTNDESMALCQVMGILGTTKYPAPGITRFESAGWGDGVHETVSLSGKSVEHITSGTGAAMGAGDKNVNDYTNLKFDIWCAETTTFGLQLACWNGGWQYGTKKTFTTTAESWKTVDIALSEFGHSTANLSTAVLLYFQDLANKPFYITNIYYYTTSTACDAEPDDAPEEQTLTDCQVYSLFSDYGYPGQKAQMNNALWCGGTAENVTIAGKAIKKLSGSSGCYGFEKSDWGANGTINASAYDYLHIDVWMPIGATVRFFPINRNSANDGNDPEKYVERTIIAGSWQSVNIPLSEFTAQGLDLSRVYQFKFEGLAGKKMWFTNLYFYKTATCTPDWENWNLALNKPSYAGYDNNNAYQSNDENLGSRWGSNGATHPDQDWWYVDLGRKYVLDKIDIVWEGAYSNNFIIQTATELPANPSDDSQWTTIYTYTGTPTLVIGNATTDHNYFDVDGIGRYVRIKSLQNATGYGISFWEFRVYGSDYALDDPIKPVMSSATLVSKADAVRLNLQATDNITENVVKFRVVDGNSVAHNVTANATTHIAELTDIPTGRNQTLRVYAIDDANNVSDNYIDVDLGDYVSPTDNLALLKTTWVSYEIANSDAEGKQNLNDGVLNNKYWIPYQNTGANPWMVVDLGDLYQISSIQTFFIAGARSTNYKIYARQNDPATDIVRGDNTQWVEIASKNSDISGGTDEANANTSTITYTGAVRYVRFESFSEEWDDVANGVKLAEFRVFGSAFATADNTAPEWVTATVDATSTNVTNVVLNLQATDAVDGDISTFKLSTDGGTSWTNITTTSNKYTSGSLAIGHYSWQLKAYDNAFNESTIRTINFDIFNPADNLARNKVAHAGIADANATQSNDDITTNRWGSYGHAADYSDDWWYVDLGDIYNINQIVIYFENAYSTDYKLFIAQTMTTVNASNEINWVELGHYTTEPQHANAFNEDARNTYNVSGIGRYICFRAYADSEWGSSIWDFQVYGTGFAAANAHAPVMTQADVVSTAVSQVTLAVAATDEDAADTPITTFLVYNSDNDDLLGQYTAVNGQIVVSGFTACQTYQLYVKAKDSAAQLSAARNVSFTFVTPLSTSYNLAQDATATAGAADGDNVAGRGIDGNLNTHWGAAIVNGNRPALADDYLQVDLGENIKLRSMQIAWLQNSRPTGYELQMSLNGTDFVPIARYSQAPDNFVGNGATEYTTYDFSSVGFTINARYLRIQATAYSLANGGAYGMEVADWKIFGDCYDEQTLPVMLFAETANVRAVTAQLRASAYCEGKTFSQIYYYVELRDKTANTTTNINIPIGAGLVNGVFTLSDLSVGHQYQAKIWAKINDETEKTSANYVVVDFETTNKSDLHFLCAENFPAGAGVWEAAIGNNAHRFDYTDVSGVYKFEHQLNDDVYQYKLYDDYSKQWTESVDGGGVNLVFCNHSGETLLMYAKGQSQFVSNFDELYVAGTTVGDPNNAWSEQYMRQMTYSDGIFSWTGDVTPNTNFKIVAKNKWDGCAGNNVVNWNRIMRIGDADVNGSAEATYAREWTHATLYFDMSTWTWWWENANESSCTRQGGPGSVNTDNDGTPFTLGYQFVSYISTEGENKYFVVEAEAFDNNGMDNAILHIYNNESQTSVTEVLKETGYPKTYTEKGATHKYFRFKKLASNIPEAVNGIIRYYVKFEGEAGMIKNTEYHYFDIVNEECSQDRWVIYHHGQKPTADDIEQFAGGTIVQPIEYRRQFQKDMWESIYLPFEVTAVKVYNETDDAYYDLLPYYRKSDGTLKGKQYIIRRPSTVTDMLISRFEEKDGDYGWLDPKAENNAEIAGWLPQQNTPYIIQFHNDYYVGRWICFFGKKYSNIDTQFTEGSAPTQSEVVNIYGNNTMQQQHWNGRCYLLNLEEYEGLAWTRFSNPTIYPFECYILADEHTTTRYRIIRKGAAEEVDVPTQLNDEWRTELHDIIRVFNVSGQLIATLNDMSIEQAAQTLSSELQQGIYMLQAGNEVVKLMQGGK